MKTPTTLFFPLLFLLPDLVSAQLWQQIYPGSAVLEIISTSNDSLTLLNCALTGRTFLHIDAEDGSLNSMQAAGFCESSSTFDGGTITTDIIQTAGNGSDVQITKYDLNGNLVWQHVLGDSLEDHPMKFIETRDSGIVVAIKRQYNPFVFTSQDIDLWKIDKNGNIVWGGDYLNVYCPSGFVVGMVESRHNRDIILYYSSYFTSHEMYSYFKTIGENGAAKYSNVIFGGVTHHIRSVLGTTWGGVYVKYDISYIPPQGVFTIDYYEKTFDENGVLTTHPKYAAVGQAMPDGGTLFCKTDNEDLFVARVNANGDTLAHNNFQGAAKDIVQTTSGSIFVAGSKYGQSWLMKLDSTMLFTDDYVSICPGASLDNIIITQDTIVIDTFVLANYDSIVFHHVKVLATHHLSLSHSICLGDSISFSGQWYSDPGLYIDSLQTVHGCDSIVTLNLGVSPLDTTSTAIELCEHEASPLTGIIYDDNGVYAEQVVLQNQYGCDSMVMGTVTVHPEEILWADNGPLTYGMIYHGVVLTQDTQFILFDTTEFGCLLTISENVWVWSSATHNQSEGQIQVSIAPNPFDSQFRLQFYLDNAGIVSATVEDALGKEVAIVTHEKRLTVGYHDWEVPTKEWPSGVYTFRLQVDEGTIARKIIKL